MHDPRMSRGYRAGTRDEDLGEGLQLDNTGRIQVRLGDGLQLDAQGGVEIQPGLGLRLNLVGALEIVPAGRVPSLEDASGGTVSTNGQIGPVSSVGTAADAIATLAANQTKLLAALRAAGFLER